MPAEIRTLAIDVGATRTRFALVSEGVIGARLEKRTSELTGPYGVVEGVVAEARDLLAAAGHPPVAAVGMGLAAGVDRSGSVVVDREFGIPAGPALRDALTSAFEVPVAINNDANLAALAEQRLGAARGHDAAAVLTLGSNIGLGLILDGEIHRGAHGVAGEVGLLLVPAVSDGERSNGRRTVDAGRFGRVSSAAPEGYAWVEELVGGRALATAATATREPSVQPSDDGSAATGHPRILTEKAIAQPELRPIAQRAVDGWALIIADLSVLLDLEIVVLTGGVAADAEHLLDSLRRRVAELVALAPEIRLGSLGPDAELLGADLFARAALDAGAARYARAGLSAHSTGERR